MTDYLTEQEQIELLKNWIKQYSLVILVGFAIAIAAITGWRYWQQRQAKMDAHASSIYDEMLTVRAQNEPKAILTQADKLFKRYSKTAYGPMAVLMLARTAVINKHYSEAEKQLHWVMDNSSTPAIAQIARIRLARVLIAENKPEEGIQLLDKINDQTFNGLIDEVKGDAYLAMKNENKARESYKLALEALPNAEIMRPLLRMKYDNLQQ